MAEETFSYSNDALASGEQVVESSGFFTDWILNMFAGAIDIQINSPMLTAVYIGLLLALVILRLYSVNPIKTLGCLLIYVYTVVQAYNLYRESIFVTDFTPEGWQVTAKSIWFAVLFTGIWVWGVSRVLQSFILALVTMGVGRLLAPINPMRLLNKLRSSDAELEAMDEGSAKNPKSQLTAIMFTDIVGYSKQMGANEAAC
jgi:hypothetical protein